MISFELSEDQRMVQETVRKFAAEEIRPHARAWEKARGVAEGARKQFDELSLALVDVPEEIGGLGMGLLTACVVHEELAFGDPGAAVALWGPHLVPAALACLCPGEQARRWIEKVKIGSVVWDPAHVVNGGVADVTVILGAHPRITTVVSGGPRKDWLGLETVHVASVQPGDGEAIEGVTDEKIRKFFAWAQLVTAARQVGLARAAFEYALAYDQERVAFGKPVAHFQAVAFNLADMHMAVESARWMVWKAAVSFDPAECARAFAHANDVAWRVADDGVQLLGGAGYIQDHPVEKWLRDTKALGMIGARGVDEQPDVTVT